MSKLTKAILGLSLAIAAGCVSVPKVDNVPVAALDLDRHLGEWYEIAQFDHSFERGVEHVKALRYGIVVTDGFGTTCGTMSFEMAY